MSRHAILAAVLCAAALSAPPAAAQLISVAPPAEPPEPELRPIPPDKSIWRRDKRRPYPYRPYYFYGERRSEPPEREVVIIERPAPQPEPPAEPAAPPPRIDACRTAPAVAEEEVGSGRVLFMDPPPEGCPRFSRAPVAEAPRLPTLESEPAQ